MAAHNLRIDMNRLRQRDATTKMTGFESEFKVNSYTRVGSTTVNTIYIEPM